MVKDYPNDVPSVPGPTPPRDRGRWLEWLLLAVAGAGVSAAATSFLMAHFLFPGEAPRPRPAPKGAAASPSALFRDWPADVSPDVVLVISGEQHGYLQPCGCSKPQLGGLPRRWVFVQELKKRGWPVVAVDLGDIPDEPKRRGPQAMLKYVTSMEALRRIGYAGVGVGLFEMQMPLQDALANYALNNPTPRMLAANLKDRAVTFFDAVGSSHVAEAGPGLRVGIVSTMGPSTTAKVKDPQAQFESNAQVLPPIVKQLQDNKAELLVLLYHGTLEEAKACAAKFPQFQVIVTPSRESEPPSVPDKFGSSLIITVGHKGRYVGVVGAFRNKTKGGFDLHYQLAPLGENLETPPDKADSNPIMVLMEEYARQVKDMNMLSRYPKTKHPIQVQFPEAEYVGSEACKSCHRESYKVWENSAHSHAYQTLVDATHPSLRQYDGECIVCHVVGFEYLTGFRDEKTTPDLINVGCENCHGPGSVHLADKNNKQIHDLMNPFRPPPGEDPTSPEAKRRLLHIDQSCQKCHDIDNDVHWNFEKKWPKVVHREKKKG
ncbi:MAG: hypothetical protein NZ700_00120 [Gemmataceae bacterium]|nr:hypothetical protein [Gemmataceae bacterium]MDW8265117.1 multiheme c-type cytochrome [Gemmataceae bacterium]